MVGIARWWCWHVMFGLTLSFMRVNNQERRERGEVVGGNSSQAGLSLSSPSNIPRVGRSRRAKEETQRQSLVISIYYTWHCLTFPPGPPPRCLDCPPRHPLETSWCEAGHQAVCVRWHLCVPAVVRDHVGAHCVMSDGSHDTLGLPCSGSIIQLTMSQS